MEPVTLLGRTVGCYAVSSVLGTGGMGVVYRAYDVATSRHVALKVLAAGTVADGEATEWFEREARWLTTCDDPHIVPVYSTGRTAGINYIAMELMAATLHERIAAHRPDIDEVVEVGAGILLGLAAAHRVGIIHRDIKPANVGIAANGVVKLLDFGIAHPLPWSAHVQDAATCTSPMACVGSLHYMPPEQLRGDAMDERADIYSAGAVLYELATGLRPFPEVRPACLIDSILNNSPLPPSTLNTSLTSTLDTVLLRALAKRPSARFLSVLAMMDGLLEVLTVRRGIGQKPGARRTPRTVSSGWLLPRSDGASYVARRADLSQSRRCVGPGIDGVPPGTDSRR